jgi:tryptophan synthase alpha chain
MTPRLQHMFQYLRAQERGGFVPFAMLGDPDEATCLAVLRTFLAAGADMLEMGLPFSDPPADGPENQAAAVRALTAGMTTHRALALLQILRAETEVPFSLLCYANPLEQFGLDAFYQAAAAAGVDAVLVADVPLEELAPFATAAAAAGVATVSLAAPHASAERLRAVAASTTGFLYAAARLGVTGEAADGATGKATELAELCARVRGVSALPVVAGFGLATPQDVRAAINAGCDAAIVGSALVRRIRSHLSEPARILTELDATCRALRAAI